jgi:hypothetical protein
MRYKTLTASRGARALLAGSLGGFVSGITGVGGGALFVPLMTGVSRLPQHVAHGTSLAIVIFAAAAGAVTYIARGEVEWDLVAAIIGGAVVGAFLGATAMPHVSPQRLRLVLAVFLAAVGIRILAGS